jgi:hypothetical protein
VLAQDNNTTSPGEGLFVTSTVNYTYSPAHSALVGQPLEIRLLSKGLGGDEMEFDDVKLTLDFLANPVANPGGPYSVLSIGSLSLDGSASQPSYGETITSYDWDLDNDGDYDEGVTGATPAAIAYATLTGTYGMSVGSNTIKLRVTDSAAKTSTVSTTVTLAIASSNANLSNLVTIPATTFSPSFDPGTLPTRPACPTRLAP